VIETDSPYSASDHAREMTEPALIIHTAQAVAVARGQNLGSLLSLTTANAERLFRVRVPASAGAR